MFADHIFISNVYKLESFCSLTLDSVNCHYKTSNSQTFHNSPLNLARNQKVIMHLATTTFSLLALLTSALSLSTSDLSKPECSLGKASCLALKADDEVKDRIDQSINVWTYNHDAGQILNGDSKNTCGKSGTSVVCKDYVAAQLSFGDIYDM